MKRSLCLLAAMVVLLAPWSARADEPAELQLEFARKLRTKHYSSLALEYLEKYQKTAPAEMRPLLALEIARTRVSLAEEKEPEQRAPLFAQARSELEAFLQANAEHPEAPQARVEVARLAALQAKALLSAAFRQETRAAQITGAVKARQQFIAAGKELEAAVRQLGSLKEKYATGKTDAEKILKDKAEEGYLRVLLDRARNYLDQVDTYIDEGTEQTLRERSQVIDDAKKILNKVADLNIKGPEPTLARAMLVRCFQLSDAPREATNLYKRIMTEAGPQPKAGQRLAMYYYIRGIGNDPSVGKDKDKETIAKCTDWLKNFAAYKNTPEGQLIRFEFAQSLVAENQGQKTPRAAELLRQAQKDLAQLATSDSDIAAQANELSLTLSVARIKGLPLEKLTNFDDCFLKARYEIYLLQKESDSPKKGAPPPEKQEQERKARLKAILAALKRALRLADSKTPSSQLTEARYYLTFVYLLSGDPYRAAVLGESTARGMSGKRAATAAGYALDGYAAVLDFPNGNNEANREHLRKLAEFVLKDRAQVWSGDQVTPLARYQLAMVALRDKKTLEAIDELEKLPPDFSSYVFSQSQLAIAAIGAAREAKSEEERAALHERALKALDRIPTLPPHPDPATAQMFFAAQLDHGSLLYTAAGAALQKGDVPEALKKYEAFEKFATGLAGQFDKMDVKLSPDVHAKLGFAVGNLKKYGKLGLASAEYRVGDYDKVLALTDHAVKAVKEQDKGEGPIVLKDYKVTGNLLGLNLRARVQKGAVAEAKELWPLLRRLQGEDNLESDSSAVLQALVQDLRSQVKALQEKAKTDPAAKTQLEALAGNFTTFLNELANQTDQKAMLQNLFFIANCYSSLGKHKEAADLYGKIPEPKPDADAKPEEAEKQVGTYWYIQIQRARELRLAGKEALEAGKVAEAQPHFAEARQVLAKIPTTYRSFSVQQEDIYLLEDQHLFGAAIKSWSALMNNPHLVKKITTDNEAKKLYFDCYYHFIESWYQYGKYHKVAADQAKYIRKAADYIVRLETAKNQDGWQLIGSRLRELLQAEPQLRAQYDQLKKAGP
jgi:hypothetical protein